MTHGDLNLKLKKNPPTEKSSKVKIWTTITNNLLICICSRLKMDSYDEDLSVNTFFTCFQNKHTELYNTATTNRWIVSNNRVITE